ncbi:MAG: hypothetical protein GEU96_19180 [Propionibacteriales bacterium]|nr:hypothetical protein [Propionibacteriales bacterium]
MTDQSQRATLRPAQAAPGSRRGVRRSRLVLTPGAVRATEVCGQGGTAEVEVTAIVDNPVDLPGDGPEATAGTIGLRHADGSSAYFHLADWWPLEIGGNRDRKGVLDELAAALAVPVERPDPGAAAGPRWQPAASYATGQRWLSRIGAAVPGLLLLAALLVIAPGWLGDRQLDPGERDLARTLLVLAAGSALVVAVALQGLWLWRVQREGKVPAGGELRPMPHGETTGRFRRRARLQWVGDELRVVGDDGREQWLGGPDDRFGVVEIEAGPGYRYERPDAPGMHLLDRDGRALASLDLHDWFGAPDAMDTLHGWAAGRGVLVSGPTPTKRKRGLFNLYGDRRTLLQPWLADAGLSGAMLVRNVAFPFILVWALWGTGARATVAVAVGAVLVLLVPAVVRAVVDRRLSRVAAAR